MARSRSLLLIKTKQQPVCVTSKTRKTVLLRIFMESTVFRLNPDVSKSLFLSRLEGLVGGSAMITVAFMVKRYLHDLQKILCVPTFIFSSHSTIGKVALSFNSYAPGFNRKLAS